MKHSFKSITFVIIQSKPKIFRLVKSSAIVLALIKLHSLYFRGKTEDVAEAEEDSEVVEGSGVEVASEAVAASEATVEASEEASEDEEVAVTEGCLSEAGEEGEEEEIEEAHHSEEAEAVEKVARDSNHELNITLKTKFGKFTLSSSTPKLFWAFSRDLFSTLRSKHRL